MRRHQEARACRSRTGARDSGGRPPGRGAARRGGERAIPRSRWRHPPPGPRRGCTSERLPRPAEPCRRRRRRARTRDACPSGPGRRAGSPRASVALRPRAPRGTARSPRCVPSLLVAIARPSQLQRPPRAPVGEHAHEPAPVRRGRVGVRESGRTPTPSAPRPRRATRRRRMPGEQVRRLPRGERLWPDAGAAEARRGDHAVRRKRDDGGDPGEREVAVASRRARATHDRCASGRRGRAARRAARQVRSPS